LLAQGGGRGFGDRGGRVSLALSLRSRSSAHAIHFRVVGVDAAATGAVEVEAAVGDAVLRVAELAQEVSLLSKAGRRPLIESDSLWSPPFGHAIMSYFSMSANVHPSRISTKKHPPCI
jgi:hypothetical protein